VSPWLLDLSFGVPGVPRQPLPLSADKQVSKVSSQQQYSQLRCPAAQLLA